jgi:hypothetical protein
MKILFVTYDYLVEKPITKDRSAFTETFSKCKKGNFPFSYELFTGGDKIRLATKIKGEGFGIIHFFLHGEPGGKIKLSDKTILSKEDILNFFNEDTPVKAVIFNCCYSADIAGSLNKKMKYRTLGWPGAPDNMDTSEITPVFYEALFNEANEKGEDPKLDTAFWAVGNKKEEDPVKFCFEIFIGGKEGDGGGSKKCPVLPFLKKCSGFLRKYFLLFLSCVLLVILLWTVAGKPEFSCTHRRSGNRVEILVPGHSSLFTDGWLKLSSSVNFLWMKEYRLIIEDKYHPVQIPVIHADFRYNFEVQRNTRYYLVNGKDTVCRNEILYLTNQ